MTLQTRAQNLLAAPGATFARGAGNRGNPEALRRWYDDKARSHINWGTAGDFARCVEIAGKYIDNPQGYCQLRHMEATGAPAGHAPGEGKVAHMADWDSDEKRKKAPASTFCGPGRSFPVDDCEDVSHARMLLHHAKPGNQSSISSCVESRAKTMKCGASQNTGKADHAMPTPESVSFNFAAQEDLSFADGTRTLDAEGMVIRRGKIFGPGTHTPGNIGAPVTFTADHMALIAENSDEPFDIGMGHTTSGTPLDGQMGYAKVIGVEDDGDIMGESHTPVWLDDRLVAAGFNNFPVSVELDVKGLRIKKLALATNQVVPDAELAAAFAASTGTTLDPTVLAAFAVPPHKTPTGQRALQDIHDDTVRAGAVCRKPSATANMASRPEANTIQAVHDMTADGGAQCHDLQAGGANKGWGMGMFARGVDRMGMKKFWKRPDVQQAAEEEGLTPEELAAHFATPAAELSGPEAARVKELERRLADAETRGAAAEARHVRGEAAQFAERMVKTHLIMPANEEELVGLLVEFAADDSVAPVAHFANGTARKPRAQRLAEFIESLEPHYLSKEMLPEDMDAEQVVAAFANLRDTKGRILPDGAVADPLANDPARMRESRGYQGLMDTELGRRATQDIRDAANKG